MVGKKRLFRFAGAGIVITIFDYILYTSVMFFIFRNNTNLIACATIVSGTASTFVAYALHSHYTWRERDPGKYGILKFFIWNIIAVSLIRPIISSYFEQWDWLFEFAHQISSGIGLPFTYEFIVSTGAYLIMITVLTVLNYVVYTKLVFNKERKVLTAIYKRRAKTAVKKTEKQALRAVKTAKKQTLRATEAAKKRALRADQKSAEAAKKQHGKQVNMKSVGQTGKEQKRKRVAKKQSK